MIEFDISSRDLIGLLLCNVPHLFVKVFAGAMCANGCCGDLEVIDETKCGNIAVAIVNSSKSLSWLGLYLLTREYICEYAKIKMNRTKAIELYYV